MHYAVRPTKNEFFLLTSLGSRILILDWSEGADFDIYKIESIINVKRKEKNGKTPTYQLNIQEVMNHNAMEMYFFLTSLSGM